MKHGNWQIVFQQEMRRDSGKGHYAKTKPDKLNNSVADIKFSQSKASFLMRTCFQDIKNFNEFDECYSVFELVEKLVESL